MTVDIVNKIIKTYDHNNKLVKMVDEEYSGYNNIKISYFEYYIFFVIVNETTVLKDNSIFHRTKIRLTFYGWIILIFTLASLSLFYIS